LVATAFHRNSKTNVEGGTDDEEYRLLAVMDRVSTTWQSWMGTTFGCVQCHSHPYDPFPHESYYEFLAYFDNTLDHNLTDDFPVLDYAIQPEDRERAFALQQTIRELQAAYVKPFQTLSNSTAWTPWRYQKATATQGAIISIERDEQGRQVLQTGPNAPKGTLHTLLISPPATPLQALRIDAPMLDGATVTMPGDPFVLSYLEAAWVDPEGAETPISFERVISDEIHPRSSPELSLVEKNAQGWSLPQTTLSRLGRICADRARNHPEGCRAQNRDTQHGRSRRRPTTRSAAIPSLVQRRSRLGRSLSFG
jgi:hypothetical protein